MFHVEQERITEQNKEIANQGNGEGREAAQDRKGRAIAFSKRVKKEKVEEN